MKQQWPNRLIPCFNECSLVFPRLAKLVFQWDPNLCIQRKKSSSGRTTLSTSQLHCSSLFEKENNALTVVTCSHSLKSISSEQGEFPLVHLSVLYALCADWSLFCPFPYCSGSKSMYNLVCLPSSQKKYVNHPDVSTAILCLTFHILLYYTSTLSFPFPFFSNLKSTLEPANWLESLPYRAIKWKSRGAISPRVQ